MIDEKKDDTQKPVEQDLKSAGAEDKDRVIPEASFLQLTFLFGAQAMQSLGLIPSPLTKKTELDLVLAKFNIDILEMLKEKTKGNLTKDEEKGLEELLFSLRMQYVEVANKNQSQ